MDPSFPSLNLDEKLKRVAGKSNLSEEVARAIVEDTRWTGQMWDHDDIQRVLFSEDPPQQIPSYAFGCDHKDKETVRLLTTLNYYKVVKKLHAKYSCLSKPESSAAHPSKGPFVIRKDAKATGHLVIRNSKGTEAIRFAAEAFRLDTQGYSFTMTPLTYHVLCKASEDVIDLLKSTEISGQLPWSEMAKPSNGPFFITNTIDEEGTKYVSSEKGVIADVSQALRDAWTRPKKTAKSITFGTESRQQYDASTNPSAMSKGFMALADETGKQSAVPKSNVPKPSVSKSLASTSPSTRYPTSKSPASKPPDSTSPAFRSSAPKHPARKSRPEGNKNPPDI